MSDELRLLAVIIIIYLADCLYWIPRNGISVTRFLGNTWKLRLPGVLLGNDRGALGLANPLPPLGLASRSMHWPLAFSPCGVCAAGERIPRSEIAWDAIQKIEREEKKVLINDVLFYKAASPYEAETVAEAVVDIWKLPKADRAEKILREMRKCLNANSVKERLAQFEHATRHARFAGQLLFWFLFAFTPVLVWRFGLVRMLPWLIALLLLQTITISILFRAAHRQLYPRNGSDLFKPFLTLIVAPPSAIRAQDILARPLLESFHPLAVTQALCFPVQAKQFAEAYLRDLEYPRWSANSTETHEGQTGAEWFRIQSLALVREFLQRHGLPSASPPPVPTEAAHIAYCPRCLQQFTSHQTACVDCGDRSLVSFATTKLES